MPRIPCLPNYLPKTPRNSLPIVCFLSSTLLALDGCDGACAVTIKCRGHSRLYFSVSRLPTGLALRGADVQTTFQGFAGKFLAIFARSKLNAKDSLPCQIKWRPPWKRQGIFLGAAKLNAKDSLPCQIKCQGFLALPN